MMFSEMTKDQGFPDKVSNYAALILPRKAAAVVTDYWEATGIARCLQHNGVHNCVNMHFVLLSQVLPSLYTESAAPSSGTGKRKGTSLQLVLGDRVCWWVRRKAKVCPGQHHHPPGRLQHSTAPHPSQDPESSN